MIIAPIPFCNPLQKIFHLPFTFKARSHDPFLRIQFLVSKTGSGLSDGLISRFRFCGENVGRSFAVCSHDPFFRTNKESSICHQNDHAEFVGAFDGRSFLMCSHDPFFGTNKNWILKNGSCERAFSQTKHCTQRLHHVVQCLA